MSDPRLEKLADLLVQYSTSIQPGEKVYVRSTTAATPLIEAVYRKILQAGGQPYLWIELPNQPYLLYKYGTEAQIRNFPEPYHRLADTYDAYIRIFAEANTKALTGIDPQRIVWAQQGMSAYSKRMIERMADKSIRAVGTLFPTQAYAQDAEMSLDEYEDFVFQACMPDLDDPIGYWKAFAERQDGIIRWLAGKRKIHVTGPETDLTLDVGGRKFINCAGKVNVPDGEIFTGPVEDSAEGCVYFSYPAIISGHEVSGIRLWFEKGKVVKATAEKNAEFLHKIIATDEGSHRIGEFAIGTNHRINRFSGQILFDEKIGGSFHMALGFGYPETGSTNTSSIHWDLICDLRNGGKITVDAQIMYENGDFVIAG
jgi:aminopeptidase